MLHVVDASHPGWEEQVAVVEQVLGELELSDRPVVMVFNKADQLEDRAGFAARVGEVFEGSVVVSAVRVNGLEPLKAALMARAKTVRPTVRVVVPATDGKRIAEVYRTGEVVGREDTPEGVALTVRMEAWKAKRLRQ